MFMSKTSPLQFCKLPFMQNLLTWYFPVLKNGQVKNTASIAPIKENESKDISVIWGSVAFSLVIKLNNTHTGWVVPSAGGALKWSQSCCLRVHLYVLAKAICYFWDLS